MFVARNLARLTVVCGLALSASSPAQAPQLPQLPKPGPKQPTTPIPLPPANPATPPSLTSQDVTAFLDGFLPLQLQRDDVAGVTISITQNGQPLILKGYGYADYKKKTPVDPVATTFRPGSISKLFTYVSMMQLVEQGKLNLDADIQQYLDFPIKPGPSGIDNAPITLRNLATHTAGFEEELHDFGSDRSGKLPVDIRAFLIRNQPHRFAAPGKALAYSNYGITLIGYIVQRVSGEPFADYVQRHIFTPLGMTHSTFQQPLPPGFKATLGYLSTSKPDTGFEGITDVPAGGLSSTAADMALFGQMLLNHGTLNGQQILQPSSVATLFTPQFTPAPGVNPWDLGFYEKDRNGLRFIGHEGDLLACHSQFWVEPTHGLTFFISYNSAGATRISREEIFRALVDRYLPNPTNNPANHPPYLKLSAKDLAPYTGFYQTSRRADSTKTRLVNALSPRKVEATKEGDLTLSSLKDFHGALVHLHPIGNDSFYDEDGQSTLHFERNASSRVTGYVTPSHSDRIPFFEHPTILFGVADFALLTLFLVCIAPLVRLFRRIFFRNRPRIAPQPGTTWLTRPLQLAALASIAVVACLGVLFAHTAEITNFYQLGHLDPYFVIQNILTAIALIAIVFGVISGIRHLRRPLRLITKLKFALVTLALLYCFWFFLYFHFLGSAHHY
jgi:CubicO group peptidase (beta-lactamase class C family)